MADERDPSSDVADQERSLEEEERKIQEANPAERSPSDRAADLESDDPFGDEPAPPEDGCRPAGGNLVMTAGLDDRAGRTEDDTTVRRPPIGLPPVHLSASSLAYPCVTCKNDAAARMNDSARCCIFSAPSA